MNNKLIRSSLLCGLALLMMGNEGCEEAEQKRELRRRVQMGMVDAPAMPLPNGGRFDFKFAANAQMYDVLRKTQSFSTSTMRPGTPLDPSQMTDAERRAFSQCEDVDGYAPFVMSQNAACMIHMPQAIINGEIVNFQLISGGGLSISLPDFGGLSSSFDVKKARLTMSLKADDPLIPGHNIAATTTRANQFEMNIRAGFNLGSIGLGPRYYYQSDLAEVVSKAMQNGISDLKTQFDEAEPWYAMVLKNCDKAILINAGNSSDAGLKTGDILEVYNVWYDWAGLVCDSTLMGSMRATAEPIAVAQVEIVGNTFSQARIIEQTATKILPGARVYVRKLVQLPPTQKVSGAQKVQRVR
ncbi:MAG: hypothetical protein LW875_00145 [Proteobacteria bacterium]|jgi:hypothetical protein|nr:hypothetical protein [Pseudomonadota bacterium]